MHVSVGEKNDVYIVFSPIKEALEQYHFIVTPKK
jgi:hypothetical protein